jgi:hypothetical protein
MLFLIAAMVGLLNVAATVMTLLATGPLFWRAVEDDVMLNHGMQRNLLASI